MISEEIYKRALLLHYYKKGLKIVDAIGEICAAEGEGAMPKSTAQKWFARFRFDCTDLSVLEVKSFLIQEIVIGFAEALSN